MPRNRKGFTGRIMTRSPIGCGSHTGDALSPPPIHRDPSRPLWQARYRDPVRPSGNVSYGNCYRPEEGPIGRGAVRMWERECDSSSKFG